MHQAIRPAAVMLVLLLVVAVPAHASSLRANDVSQTLVTSGNNVQVRLRGISQSSNLALAAQNPSSTQSTGGNTSSTVTVSDPTGTASPIAIGQDPSTTNVEIIELGDVTGTVCDCGEIPGILIPGGGFPLYPLFALGAIPLAFLSFGDDEDDTFFPPPPSPMPMPTPMPTPSPEPIPEPTTLLLLGTGLAALGAGARRRRKQASELREQDAAIVEEV